MIHTFSVNINSGVLTEIARTVPSETGAGPRHAVVHSSSKYLYVIDEEGLRVDQFALDISTGKISHKSQFGRDTFWQVLQGLLKNGLLFTQD